MADREFCRALAVDEPLLGTAQAETTRWIVLEDGSPWGAKVPKQTSLPAHVVAWLERVGDQPGSRVQLIRQPGSSARGSRRKLVLARTPSEPSERRYVELDVELDALPELDIDALLEQAGAAPPDTQLWLVCTHGTRDRCCAKWGMELWDALRGEVAPARVWQCSHLGGHRFAPTMLALPSGLQWGRLELGELAALVAADAGGRIGALAKLRGRSCYSTPAQAAECLLRLREGWDLDVGLRLRDVIGEGQGTRVRFEGPAGAVDIVVAQRDAGLATPSSCGDAAEPRRRFAIVD